MKPTLPNVSFAKSTRLFICSPEFYFFKKQLSCDIAFLISQGTISHILGAGEDMHLEVQIQL